MQYEDFAYDRTKGERKEQRRTVRNALGTSSEEAPHIYNALWAARALGHIIRLASAGRFELQVYEIPTATHRTPQEALRVVREMREARSH